MIKIAFILLLLALLAGPLALTSDEAVAQEVMSKVVMQAGGMARYGFFIEAHQT